MPGIKIKNIKAKGFLSFKDVELSDLGESVNFIVGPNGGGKTNFARLFKFILKEVLDPLYFQKTIFLKRGSNRIELEIDLEFILSSEEDKMIHIILSIIFLIRLERLNVRKDPQDEGQDSNQLHDLHLMTIFESFKCFWDNEKGKLNAGKLIIIYDDIANKTEISYKPKNFKNIIFDIKNNFLKIGDGQNNVQDIDVSKNYSEIINTLSNSIRNNLEGNTQYPIYIDDFHSNVFIQEAKKINEKIGIKNSSEVIKNIENFENSLQLESNRGINRVGVFTILNWIFKNSIINLDTFRCPSNNRITIKDIENTGNFDGNNLYQFLLKLKIYQPEDYAEVKKLFNELSGGKDFDIKIDSIEDFSEKISISPMPIYQQRDVNLESTTTLNQSSVGVYVTDHKLKLGLYFKDNKDSQEEYPFEFSPAGYYEMLTLSTLVAGLKNKVIILDEPAQNLHPTFQHKLLNNILAENKNQFFIITHSPDLVEIDKKDKKGNIFIFRNKDTNTEISRFIPENIEKIQLFKYEELKRLFFAKGAVLAEGFSEEILAKRLIRNNDFFEKIKGSEKFNNDVSIGNIEDVSIGDIEIVNIEGIGSLVNYIKLMEKLKLHYVAIIDSDIFDDPKKIKDNKEKISNIAKFLSLKSDVKPSLVKNTLKEKCPVFYQGLNFEKYVEEEFGDKFEEEYLKWCKEKFGSNDDDCNNKSRKKINYPLYLTETKELFKEIINGNKLKIYSDAIQNLIKQINKNEIN
jgi:AAA15 family ATPase/GTPase